MVLLLLLLLLLLLSLVDFFLCMQLRTKYQGDKNKS